MPNFNPFSPVSQSLDPTYFVSSSPLSARPSEEDKLLSYLRGQGKISDEQVKALEEFSPKVGAQPEQPMPIEQMAAAEEPVATEEAPKAALEAGTKKAGMDLKSAGISAGASLLGTLGKELAAGQQQKAQTMQNIVAQEGAARRKAAMSASQTGFQSLADLIANYRAATK